VSPSAYGIPLSAGEYIVALHCQFCQSNLGTTVSAINRPSSGACDPCYTRVKATAKAAREALRRNR
jgi:hypothetical protein